MDLQASEQPQVLTKTKQQVELVQRPGWTQRTAEKMPAEPVKSIDKSISIPLTKQQQGERAKGLMVPSPSTVGIAFSVAAAKACWGRGVSPLEILQLPYDDVDLNGRWAAAIMAAAAM